MRESVYAALSLLFLLLASGFMDSVDFFGMDYAIGFLGAFSSLLASIFCMHKSVQGIEIKEMRGDGNKGEQRTDDADQGCSV